MQKWPSWGITFQLNSKGGSEFPLQAWQITGALNFPNFQPTDGSKAFGAKEKEQLELLSKSKNRKTSR